MRSCCVMRSISSQVGQRCLKLSRKIRPTLEPCHQHQAAVIQRKQHHSYNKGPTIHQKPYPDSLESDPGLLQKLVDLYDTFLVDCDGVLWGTDHVSPLQNIAQSIEKLRQHGKKLVFVTNNSTHSRNHFRDKFQSKCGFQASPNEVFGVCHAAAVYLKTIAKIQGKVYTIGSKGMSEELDEVGLENFGHGPDPDPLSDCKDRLLEQRFHDDVQAVLVGFDVHINYNKIYKAGSYLSNDQVLYIATNDIETWSCIGENRVKPLTGVMNAAINAVSGRQPTVIGKPHGHLMACVMAEYPDLDLRRTVMIGDSLRTDISFACNAGIDSVLVLTGATNVHMLKHSCQTGQYAIPNYVLQNFGQFGELL